MKIPVRSLLRVNTAKYTLDSTSFMDAVAPMLGGGGVNAWSVTGSDQILLDPDLASNLFAISLFPYLAFLYFLGSPQTKAPKGVNFGFQFLLVFVLATIPAGVIAKTQYQDGKIDYRSWFTSMDAGRRFAMLRKQIL